jgi:hypothetical protein
MVGLGKGYEVSADRRSTPNLKPPVKSPGGQTKGGHAQSRSPYSDYYAREKRVVPGHRFAASKPGYQLGKA